MGRIKNTEERVGFSVRMPLEMKKQIDALANLERRTMTDQVVVLLRNALRAELSSRQVSGYQHQPKPESRRVGSSASLRKIGSSLQCVV